MSARFRAPTRGWRSKLPATLGEMIRQILIDEGEANPLTIYSKVREYAERFGVKWFGSYESIRRTINILKTLGLIEEVRRDKASNPRLHEKVFYRIVREKAGALAWRIPRQTLYPETVYGSRLYNEKRVEAAARGITVSELAQIEHPEILMARRELGLPTPS